MTAGASPNGNGQFTLGWTGDDPLQYFTLSYALQHHNAATGTWSTVAGAIGALSYSFDGAGEEEGTWVYRVQGSDPTHGQTTEYSPVSAPVVVDETPPFPPSTSVSRAPDYAGNGGWYMDSVKVSFSKFTDATLSDGSPGSGIDPASIPASQTFTTSGVHTGVRDGGRQRGQRLGTGLSDRAGRGHPAELSKSRCPATALAGSNATATVTASDPYSGLETDPSGTVPIDTEPRGRTDDHSHSRLPPRPRNDQVVHDRDRILDPGRTGAHRRGEPDARTGLFTLGWSGPDPLHVLRPQLHAAAPRRPS